MSTIEADKRLFPASIIQSKFDVCLFFVTVANYLFKYLFNFALCQN